MSEHPDYNENRNWSAYGLDSHLGDTGPMRRVPSAGGQSSGSAMPAGRQAGRWNDNAAYGSGAAGAGAVGYSSQSVGGFRPDYPGQPAAGSGAASARDPYAPAGYRDAPASPYPLNEGRPDAYARPADADYGRRGRRGRRPRKRGGCGCTTLISAVLVVALAFTMWPQLLPSSDIIRGLQIDQMRDWVTDTFGFEWPTPSEEEFQAIYNQEDSGDSTGIAAEPSTSLSSVADAVHYYRNTLDEHAQTVYDALEEGILAHDARISMPFGTTEEELQTCWQFVLYDHPEVFYLPDDAHVSYWSWGGSVSYIEPEYKYDAETAAQLSAEYEQLAADLPLLGSTAAETMQNICDYVADTTDYVDSGDDQSIDSVFSRGQSVCAGYAKAVQYLAQRHSIPCIYITGTAEDFLGTGGSHAWIAAFVDGEVLYYDPTWYDQRGFHATQYLGMNLVDISVDHTADYPSLLPR